MQEAGTNNLEAARVKAQVLIEALPYIERFYGKTIVIKYGGHAMASEELKDAVMQNIVLMKYVGMNPVVVHGGGPAITGMLDRLGIESQFVGGLRVTDQDTMEVAEMVLGGKINKEIVTRLCSLGGKAIGLTGKDAGLIRARKKMGRILDKNGSEQLQDIGLVGEVEKIDPAIVNTLLKEGYIPVISPIGCGEDGESYNINADYVAGELAAALGADKLIILTDVRGIMKDINDENSLLSEIKVQEVPFLIAQGIIKGGMIPKIECCVHAVDSGVNTAHIVDGRIPNSILLEIFTRVGIGTMVAG